MCIKNAVQIHGVIIWKPTFWLQNNKLLLIETFLSLRDKYFSMQLANVVQQHKQMM